MTSDLKALLQKIDKNKLPAHVAIIMDGNGRWAKKRHLPRLLGHRMGAKSVREIVEASSELGIQVLTLYAFSTENWSRSKPEVEGLMRLLKRTLQAEEPHLKKNNVRLETIGDITQLPSDVQKELARVSKALSHGTGLRLVLALNYGGRQEIVRACNALISEGHKHASEALLQEHLYTATMPDPDLLIRTSGEFRVSNFLLWQIAYAEVFITQCLWPDFRKKQFYEALIDYQSRERRFGGVN